MNVRERNQFDDVYGRYLLAESQRRVLEQENAAFVQLLEELLTSAHALLAASARRDDLLALLEIPTDGRSH
jgi:hypothetical protein